MILKKRKSPGIYSCSPNRSGNLNISSVWPMLLTLLVLCMFALPNLAVEQNGVSMEILVRGKVAKEWPCKDKRYVEAVKNRDYAIRLTNHTGRRMAVALAVDGLNTINGQRTTAWDGPKWVLEPWGSVTVSGWQTNSSEARKFYFTTEKKSYAGKRGEVNNLGVIAAVAFPEKVIRKRRWEYDGFGKSQRESGVGGRYDQDSSADAPQAAPEAEAAPRNRQNRDEEKRKLSENAATGMGDAMNNPIRRVSLQLDSRPCATLSLRYEFRNTLMAKGIMPRPKPKPKPDPWTRRENSSGFDDMAFCPVVK